VTSDTRSMVTDHSHLRAASVYAFLYTVRHPEHRLVFYKPQMVSSERATSGLADCDGAVQRERHIESFGGKAEKKQHTRREGLAGPEGCVLGQSSWAQVPALQAAHAQYPDADYIVWHDGDAVINPEYFDQSFHQFLRSVMPLDDGPPPQPIMLNLEQGNWWCTQTMQAGGRCFNVGTIVMHGHRDARVAAWLDAWWHTSIEPQDSPPSDIMQRRSFMGNSKGLMMAVNDPRFAPLVMNAPPGVEEPRYKSAQLAGKENGFHGLWRWEGVPYNAPKEKGTAISETLACDLVAKFLPAQSTPLQWTGTRQMWTACEWLQQCQCASVISVPRTVECEAARSPPSSALATLHRDCVRAIRPMPAVCMSGMPSLNCFMHHFYSSGMYKKWWSEKLSTLVHAHAAHAVTCDGLSPLTGTTASCQLYRSLFDPVDGNRLSQSETLHALATQIETVITSDLPLPPWAA
jgi:hypothetical protein